MSEQNKKRHIVKWKAKNGGTGEGSPITKESAIKWAELGNKAYPNLHHWVEEIPKDEKIFDCKRTVVL